MVVPVYKGRRGHPVGFDLRRYRGELSTLSADQGARSILRSHPEDVLELAVDDPGVLADIDTPEDYRVASSSCPGRGAGSTGEEGQGTEGGPR
jgi:molybdenum cofactor cytidylyltransferase